MYFGDHYFLHPIYNRFNLWYNIKVNKPFTLICRETTMNLELATDTVSCPHRWVLEGPATVRCVLCKATRTMGEAEIARIEEAVRGGAVFLKWPSDAILNARRGSKRRSSEGSTPSVSRGPSDSKLQLASEVPAGYVTAQEYATLMKMEDKKVRKLARMGRLEAKKVGGKVYVKRPG